MLDLLPPDILRTCVLGLLLPRDCVAASGVNRLLLTAARADDVWRPIFERTFHTLVAACFDGNLPQPPAHAPTWQAHYFAFSRCYLRRVRDEYKQQRLIMVIDGMLIDATTYKDQHPGDLEVLTAAAGSTHLLCLRVWVTARMPGACCSLSPSVPCAICCPTTAASRRSSLEEATVESMPADAQSLDETPRSLRESLGRFIHRMSDSDERGRFVRWLRLMSNAVVYDLTEGRPDCRRLAPAIWKMQATSAGRLSSTV